MSEAAVIPRRLTDTPSSSQGCILIVDDEAEIRESLQTLLEFEGYDVEVAANGQQGLSKLGERPFDLVLLDLALPDRNGIEILPEIRSLDSQISVIMITAYGTVEDAVRAMQSGAVNFLQKPWDNEKLLADVRAAVGRRRAEEENIQLKRALKQRYNFEHIVGKSEPMLKIFDLVAQVAPSRSTVLLQGESGTGKELIAGLLHSLSPRAAGPFMTLNTAALPATLLEAELFGYEKGAFTGAQQRKLGCFELADGGTLLLDEVGDMPLEIQAKLLRVLQDGTFERLGSSRTLQADVRIVAATHKDLSQAVAEQRFRADLFYRIHVITLHLPPLRQRREDIPLLVAHFLRKYAQQNAKPITAIAQQALQRLQAYPWPGNVRELENVIERAVVLAQGPMIGIEDLPPELQDQEPASMPEHHVVLSADATLAEIEREAIVQTLQRHAGNRQVAARVLDIGLATLYRKLKEYNLA